MKHTLLASLLVAASIGIATAADFTMRLSHQLPPTHHIAQTLDRFAEDVARETGNRVEVQIFGAEQAFRGAQNHAAVARGQVEAAVVTNFQWGGTLPEMNVMTLPYFMTDLDRLQRFPGSEAARMLEAKLLEKGVRNIAWLYTTRQSIFTSNAKPLVQTSDFAGKKIRGLSRLVDEAFVAVNAAPATMPGSEVYQALQTGVIDAGLTDVSAGYSRRFYEVQKYGTVTPFFAVYFHLFVTPTWWDRLPDDVRAGIERAAAKAEQDVIAVTEATAEQAITQLQEKGMVLHLQTAEEAEVWKAAMQPPVLEAFRALGDDAAKLVELIENL
ncbi:TRAP transporter substrate-binding protein DctP [Azoarcus taiwanensis]|uniref:C4-dicarboxylate ABC transporter n=1 Tax=Azoarcus taiwanensis TaxID=666964 RepID=A0A972J8D8_9RHOO|nr:TRAP transporter substrate-binding protein DctP [Azoarcus taiwanensis]NMG01510.1 C4-dicarboxylate ABC transporter [Azoarcus taiwanensis]